MIVNNIYSIGSERSYRLGIPPPNPSIYPGVVTSPLHHNPYPERRSGAGRCEDHEGTVLVDMEIGEADGSSRQRYEIEVGHDIAHVDEPRWRDVQGWAMNERSQA